MTRSTIGGTLESLAALARLSSKQPAPRDEATLRAAAVELRSRGLTTRDISKALGLAEAMVALLLQEKQP